MNAPKLHAFRRESKVTPVGSIELTLKFSGRKYVEFEGGDLFLNIDVPGYWGDGVRVAWDRAEQKDEPEIKYSSGGYERNYSNIQRAQNFAAAMNFAVKTAQHWVYNGWDKSFDDLYEGADEQVTPR
jgi:hypothetical protein